MAHLALALLGSFQATLDGRQVEGLGSDRLRGLLAYLAVEPGREHPRKQVASLLWPERSDAEALDALRSALSNLHQALGDRRSPSSCLLVKRNSLQFNAASDHWLDVAEFESLHGRQDVTGLERAVALYRGPFLAGLAVRDSPAFDDWLLLKGEEYRRRVLEMLGRLTALQLAGGETAAAARWARRQLELEPYREHAHRQLMLALTLGGERSAALEHYETCRRLLARELGCEPEDETEALCAQIRDGTLHRLQFPPVILSTAPGSGVQPTSRFVARERELAWLNLLLEKALAGHGGVALIAGEAGSGKTALLDEWTRRASQAHGELIVLRGNCNAHGGVGDPFLPFREILQTLAGDVEGKRAGGTLAPEQARRVWEALPVVGAALIEHGPDLIDRFVPGEVLLRRTEGFPNPPGAVHWQARLREMVRRACDGAKPAPAARLDAPATLPDLFTQLTQVLHTVSMHRPLLLAVDDLQWVDGGTAALLFHLGRRLAGSSILLACAFRSEVLVGGERQPSVIGTVIHELRREWGDVLLDLDQADGRAFIEAYVDSEPNRLGAAFRQTLYDHTGGNPLFTVELLHSFERQGTLVQDEGGRWTEAFGLDWERWPPQVEAVIAEHMATLQDEERALLQAASVQGEQFAAEVVARVLGWRDEDVVLRLSGPLSTRHRLVQAVSIERLPVSGQRLARYRFRHSLLQRGAYRSLDAAARAWLHEKTGRALEAIYAPPSGQPAGGQAEAEELRALAPELARHYETAGLPLEAARQRLEAGRWAAQLVAYDEALAHLARGLALLEEVPVSQARLALELALWTVIVDPALLRQGWHSPTFARALERLANLTQHPELQDDPQRLAALTVLALMSTWSADPARGQRVGEQLLELAQAGDRQSLLLAHWVLGHSHWLGGKLDSAREHLVQALALHDPGAGRPLIPLLGADPTVIGRAVLGMTLWLAGYPDQGRASFRQALAEAEANQRLASAAFAHLFSGIAHLLLDHDFATALRHARALRPLSRAGLEYGVWAELLAGQAGTAAADPAPERPPKRTMADGAEVQAGWHSTGPGVGHAGHLLVQAQTYARAGQTELALAATAQALAWIEHTGVRVLEAEVWRVRGESLLTTHAGRRKMDGSENAPAVRDPSSIAEAEACFRQALEVARAQQARWLELRAAVSLARLWQAQGRSDDARAVLAGICDWFGEGFDTLGLAEARALL